MIGWFNAPAWKRWLYCAWHRIPQPPNDGRQPPWPALPWIMFQYSYEYATTIGIPEGSIVRLDKKNLILNCKVPFWCGGIVRWSDRGKA